MFVFSHVLCAAGPCSAVEARVGAQAGKRAELEALARWCVGVLKSRILKPGSTKMGPHNLI